MPKVRIFTSHGPRQWRNGYTLVLVLLPEAGRQFADQILRKVYQKYGQKKS